MWTSAASNHRPPLSHPQFESEYARITAGKTVDEIDGVTPSEWAGVVLHTTWFILYLAADVGASLIYWPHMAFLKKTPFWPSVKGGPSSNQPQLEPHSYINGHRHMA
jgi:hypothetical protein